MNFWRSVFSEENGNGSFGRTSFGFVIGIVMGCIVLLTWAYAFREKPVDLAAILEGFAWFIVSVGSVTYGVNKVSLKWKGNQVDKP